jgi:hypothetical protein
MNSDVFWDTMPRRLFSHRRFGTDVYYRNVGGKQIYAA